MNGADGAPRVGGAGRYAPSPSGDLHLGNLRTAVLAWLLARSTGRDLLLRIEDLDHGRVRSGAAEAQIADLAALGVTFAKPPVWQSQRRGLYASALAELADRTYECFCSRREIAESASAPHVGPRRYPGTCRDLSSGQRSERALTRSPALRVRADGAVQTVHDQWHGALTRDVDDFVVRRNDGVAAYNLAVVVDDAAMRVDQVVRGDDLLTSAPDQAWLGQLLGAPVPAYAHVPLAVNAHGQRLAKRDGPVTLRALSADGVNPPEVLSLLAVSLGLAEPDEAISLTVLLERFDPTWVPPRTAWVVRPENLPPVETSFTDLSVDRPVQTP